MLLLLLGNRSNLTIKIVYIIVDLFPFINIAILPKSILFNICDKLSRKYFMLQNILTKNLMAFTRTKPKNPYQRRKQFQKHPDKYKLLTVVRSPDLLDPNIKFPIKIPVRFRYIYKPKRSLFIDNSSKLHWNRFSPNEILLAFQNTQHLQFREILQGLQCLSKIKGQQQHNWNQHQWVRSALDKINTQFYRLKKNQYMNMYKLMKKLKYDNEQFWSKDYKKLEQYMYDLYPSDFQYLFITYYENPSKHFSGQFKEKALKLMENRLRQFSGSSILYVFDLFVREKKLDSYWIQNVFASLFKNRLYGWNADQYAKIFRYMMLIQYEQNDRLYNSLYENIRKLKMRNIDDVETLQQVILQVKQIFASHRVQDTLQYLRQEKKRISEQKIEVKKKLVEIVKEDLTYFIEKRKMKQQI